MGGIRKMRDLAITVQDWWENAEASGKKEFETLTNLAKRTGLSVTELETIFRKEITFLGDWWEVIGKFVYRDKQKLADKLTQLIGFEYPRTTLRHQIEGSMPSCVEYRDALFALTPLPIFAPEPGSEIIAEPEMPVLTAELEKIIAAQHFGKAFLKELEELSLMDLTLEERKRLRQTLDQVSDRMENLELAQQFNELFQEEE